MASLETANQRTYEPSIKELTSQVSALEKLLEAKVKNIYDVIAERDRLYKERADSADKAIIKAEDAQKQYNTGHNDLSRKMEGQYAMMMPRTEATVKWQSVDMEIESAKRDIAVNRDDRQRDTANLRVELMKEIQGLRESKSRGGGMEEAHAAGLAQKNWGIGLLVLGFFSLASLIVAVIAALRH